MDNQLVSRCEEWLHEVQNHLRDELLPYWYTRGVDSEYGGFLTYFDEKGSPTGETEKTLVSQTRMIFSYSSMERAGFGQKGKALEIARQGVDFLLDHFWDDSHGGWVWTTTQDGTPINTSKLAYGQSFAMLALSEYGMASGDLRGMEWAVKTFETFQTFAADNRYGGYYEFCEQDWTKKKPGVYGGDRKSFDVHMHLMESFSSMLEATGAPIYHEKTAEVVDLMFDKMIHPEFGTSMAQFTPDWTPQRALIFRDVWGSDRDVEEDEGRSLNNTSFGHNVEHAWLLHHTLQLLDRDVDAYKPAIQKLLDHAVVNGIDQTNGGLFCEGPHDGPARELNKEFWQQAEALVAFLDGYLLLKDEKYLKAYENIHRFVMDVNINHEVGEWYPLFDENNTRIWDYMGHAWKINYHTVRSMIQSEKRLLKITL